MFSQNSVTLYVYFSLFILSRWTFLRLLLQVEGDRDTPIKASIVWETPPSAYRMGRTELQSEHPSTFLKHSTKCPTSCHVGTVTLFGLLFDFPRAPESWLRLEKTSWKLDRKTGNLMSVRFLNGKRVECGLLSEFGYWKAPLRREIYAQRSAHQIYSYIQVEG